MGTLLYLLVLIVILALYAFSSTKGREIVHAVEAGPTGICDANTIRNRSFIASPAKVVNEMGLPIDTSRMLRVLVCGNCMKPRNISDNMQLLVQKIDKSKPLAEQLKKNDIVMIHLADKNLDKIRVFDSFDKNGDLLTYRYGDSSERLDSSHPHSARSVIGVVRYKL